LIQKLASTIRNLGISWTTKKAARKSYIAFSEHTI
jgi:hypothetical protein